MMLMQPCCLSLEFFMTPFLLFCSQPGRVVTLIEDDDVSGRHSAASSKDPVFVVCTPD